MRMRRIPVWPSPVIGTAVPYVRGRGRDQSTADLVNIEPRGCPERS